MLCSHQLLVALLCAAALSLCSATTPTDPAALIDHINAGDFGWKAGHNPTMSGLDTAALQALMTCRKSSDQFPPEPRKYFPKRALQDLPTNFDARTKWPGCVGGVRDQARCGSCWAFGGVEALSDRFCVQTNGSTKVTLAPLDPVECDNNDDGCQGGDPLTLWRYAKRDGIVTEACAPYNDSIPTCAPADEPCLKFVPTPKCLQKCKDGSSWEASKHYAASAYWVTSQVAHIQAEIYNNGPVEGAFSVFADFVHYKSGVYRHVSGQMLGGHAIKIIGWGVDNSSTPYWTVQNSWTTTWGDDGYFLILRGKDECGIEDNIVAGLAKV